ncbi:hypothetical protein EDB83DRAFT_2550809 [Lactarius deliciosus]|nr:hypothetical protein EDB83DRAFT_2550809 [Lactarius deliciosus]
MTSAFFYGTLMHPKVLKRVLENDASHLKICHSILLDYTRHKVKNADVPAILPCERSKALWSASSHQRRMASVHYVRLQVLVHPLGPFAPVPVDTTTSGAVEDSLFMADFPPLPAANKLAQAVPAQTYVWCLRDSYLDKEMWSFDEFVRRNAWKFINHGDGPAGKRRSKGKSRGRKRG